MAQSGVMVAYGLSHRCWESMKKIPLASRIFCHDYQMIFFSYFLQKQYFPSVDLFIFLGKLSFSRGKPRSFCSIFCHTIDSFLMRYYHVPEDYNEVISYEFNE